MSMTLDTRKWDGFIRGLDRSSATEFRRGLRKSANKLKALVRRDWSGGVMQSRTGRSRKSLKSRVVSARGLLKGKPIEAQVFSRWFVVRLQERGYNLTVGRRGRVIKRIPGKNIFEQRTNEFSAQHKRNMEETMSKLIHKVSGRP